MRPCCRPDNVTDFVRRNSCLGFMLRMSKSLVTIATLGEFFLSRIVDFEPAQPTIG
jgi:hypothetical protein